jgi:hypothetical protein
MKLSIKHESLLLYMKRGDLARNLIELSKDPEAAAYLQLNEYEGATWVNKERFERLLTWFLFTTLVDLKARQSLTSAKTVRLITTVSAIFDAAEKAGYDYQKIVETVSTGETVTAQERE